MTFLGRKCVDGYIGVARGVQWVHLHPQGGVKKFFRRNLQGKCVSAPPGHEVHPQAEQESIFSKVFAGRVSFGGIFRRSLSATTKQKVVNFLARKSAPLQTKSWLRLWMANQPLLLATKATEFGEITQNNGHYGVQGHSRSPILVPSKVHIRLPVSD